MTPLLIPRLLSALTSVATTGPVQLPLQVNGRPTIVHLANRSGIEPKLVVDALSSGAGGSWALEKLGPRIAQGDFDPGFMVDLIQKDLRIVQAAAERIGLPIKGVNVAQGYFADNQKNGEGSLGTQALFKALGRLLPPED